MSENPPLDSHEFHESDGRGRDRAITTDSSDRTHLQIRKRLERREKPSEEMRKRGYALKI